MGNSWCIVKGKAELTQLGQLQRAPVTPVLGLKTFTTTATPAFYF